LSPTLPNGIGSATPPSERRLKYAKECMDMTKTRPLNPPFHLLVLHDYRFAVELLAQRLKADPAMRMVSIGHHPATALSTAARQRVDIALLDMELIDEDSISIAKDLLALSPATRLIGFSRHAEALYPETLMDLGARGFLSRASSSAEVIDAIRRVARGDLVISAEVARYFATLSGKRGRRRLLGSLTNKECAVLRLLARGCAIGEIARQLSIAVKTVQSHRCNMKRKLEVRSDVELCLLALRSGLASVH
jgi:two-component system invasion response regulator UvrY